MLEGSLTDFLNYQTYKIMHYVEAYHKLKIKKALLFFIVDDFNNLILINCTHLEFKNLLRINWSDNFLQEVQLINEKTRQELE